MPQVDEYVLAVVSERIRSDRKRIAAQLKAEQQPATDLVAELAALRDRRKRTEADYDADLIDGRRYAAKIDLIDAEMKAVERKMARDTGNAALAQVLASEDPPQAFLDAPLMSQRSIIQSLVTVTLHRGVRGRKTFDKSTVVIEPR